MDNIKNPNDTISLNPIGYIENGWHETETMPPSGKPAVIRLKEEYQPGLLELEKYSHLWILTWLHQTDRALLRVRPSQVNPAISEYGVFALRTPARPNPIGPTLVELDTVDGCDIYVSGLDAVNSTPVLDIKPYFSHDIIFSLKAPYIPPKTPEMRKESFRQKALSHHGEACLGLELGLRMALIAEEHFGNIQAPSLKLSVFKDPCLADVLQGLTLARLANPARLFYNADGRNIQVIWRQDRNFLRITVYPHVNLDMVKNATIQEVFLLDTGILRDKGRWLDWLS